MKTLFSAVCILASLAALAKAEVSNVTVTPAADVPHVYTITYELSEAAIVTAVVKTNGVSIGTANSTLCGDVYTRIAATGSGEVRTIRWFPDVSFAGKTFDGAAVTVEVTAWSDATPPDYLVVDLLCNNCRWYYPDAESLPGGIQDSRYKSSKMVFRKIPAKNVTWAMGCAEADKSKLGLASQYDICHLHKVKFMHDYYMGVYMVTDAQYYAINGSVAYYASHLPVQWIISYNQLRGSTNGARWPVFDAQEAFDAEASHAVDSNSWISKFRNRTGLTKFDLPTEAQWEFACRAGERALWYGTPLHAIARCDVNARKPDCEGKTGNTAVVGTYLPNRWGLYDTLGNTYEWCLDWYRPYDGNGYDPTVAMVDPVGAKTSQDGTRVLRGGCYSQASGWVNAATREYHQVPSFGGAGDGLPGFRMALTLY